MVFLILCRFETARWHLSTGPEKPPCSFHPLPHLLLPRSWPCLSHKPLQLAGRVCCQIMFLCQLPPFAAPAFATFLACLSHKPLQLPPFALLLAASVAKWCFYVVSKLPDGICHQGLKNNPVASTLCRTCFCHVPGHACRTSLSSFHPLRFCWPRLLPNGVSMSFRNCQMIQMASVTRA